MSTSLMIKVVNCPKTSPVHFRHLRPNKHDQFSFSVSPAKMRMMKVVILTVTDINHLPLIY